MTHQEYQDACARKYKELEYLTIERFGLTQQAKDLGLSVQLAISNLIASSKHLPDLTLVKP